MELTEYTFLLALYAGGLFGVFIDFPGEPISRLDRSLQKETKRESCGHENNPPLRQARPGCTKDVS